MESFYIKNIIDKNLFENTVSIDVSEIFNYFMNKSPLISYLNKNGSSEYDFIIDISVDTTPLNEKETEDMNIYLSKLKEEINRIEKVIEYLIANVDISKMKLLNYKIYNYDNTSKFIKSKLKSNNHNFDIKKFILKNKINKDEIILKMKQMMATDISNINENKIVIYYLLIKIIDLFAIYNKCLSYSIKLLEDYPYLFRNKDEYLCIINEKFMNITNDEINIFHHNQIKNAFTSNNKYGEIINIKRDNNKNFEILFK